MRFNASIDGSTSLKPVEKFNYNLLSYLSEEPPSCISGLTLSDANYEAAKKKFWWNDTQIRN